MSPPEMVAAVDDAKTFPDTERTDAGAGDEETMRPFVPLGR